ncbi:ubiquinone biosynthesis accessory factor UbiJ [Collimonas humicola]|uniref:ubiquinone biosynthesis accessory factor UbiJ n=1 Tax=Collimonas humicola TaxID=2825886 RepID=UPI001B8CF9EE|nr:SCP2 sterol-binding domain-containing protein [Collimonas humicola]
MTMTSPLNFKPITASVNHLLAQEPWAQRILASHAGKVACFDGGAVKLSWQVGVDGLLQAPPTDTDEKVVNLPNVTIRVNLADLPLIAQNRERAFSYVKIEGDADFANAISQVSQGLRWDAEHDLSKLVGDIAAVRIVSGGNALIAGVLSTHKKLAENLAEYFLEEQPMLVRPRAVSDFTNDVTRLRDDLERLAKRINKLKTP